MMRRLRLLSITLLATIAAVLGSVAVASPEDVQAVIALLQRPRTAQTVVVPDTFLRRWDPITVFYAGSRGPADGGPEDAPDSLVDLTPAHPGAWTWIDAHTLQFRPAEPWPALSRVTVATDGRHVDLLTLMEPPTRAVPSHGSRGLDPVDTIRLTFAQPMAVTDLSQMITIELRPLPGIGDGASRWLDGDDFELKAIQRSDPDSPAEYALTLYHPIPLGHHATVRLGLSLVDSDDAVARVEFSTAEPFRIRRFGCMNRSVPVSPQGTTYPSDQPLQCKSGARRLKVDFTAAPSDLDVIRGRNLVRFEPKVSNLAFETSGTRLTVSGDFHAQTAYKMTVAPTLLQDRNGRDLELVGETSAWVWFPRRDPYVNIAEGHGIVERYGPKTLPIEGRGHERLDVRVVRIDPLDRSLWPFPQGPVTIDESQRPPGPGEEPTPWTHPSDHIRQGDLARHLTSLATTGSSRLVELPLGADGPAARLPLDLQPQIREVLGSGAGHVLVGIRRLDGGTQRSWSRVQVTDLTVTVTEHTDTVHFLVSSLETGAPVQGAEVRLEGASGTGSDRAYSTLMRGTTDGSGSFTWRVPGDYNLRVAPVRLVVEKGDDTLALDATQPPEIFRDGLWRSEGGPWLAWAFRDHDMRGEQSRLKAHLYPERPVYRPEEKVHLRGYVRERHHGRLAEVRGSGHILVKGPGNARWKLPVELTEGGNFYAVWDESDVPTGPYTASFDAGDGSHLGRTTFRVEAYRLPTFEVDLHSPEPVPLDEPFSVTMTASYYAGGKVAEQPVRWRVTQFPFAWTPEPLEGFVYSSDGRYTRARRFEATPALTREGVSDAEGHDVLHLDPTIEPTAQPRIYQVEATVTGVDGQTITQRRNIEAVPAFALGLKVERYLERATHIPAEIVVAGPTGDLIAEQDVTVRVLARRWHSHLQASDFSDGVAKYITDVVDEVIYERQVRSGAEPLPVDLPIEAAGVYLVELEARDRIGRTQSLRVDLYAGGDEALAWSKPKAGVFQLSTDADDYRPGDTAKVLIRSPFQTGEALVVIEAPDANRYRRVAISGGKATVSIPIEEGWVPRLPVHVVLRRGRRGEVPKKATGLDLGKPQTVAATQWLDIQPVENRLAVTVDNPDKALPGETVDVTVKLADLDGRPMSGEVTLWLVDQAVLALGKEQRLDPVPDFIDQRSSYVGIRDTRNLTWGRVPFEEMPGGDEGDDEGALDKATIRRNLQPVPFYDPTIRVGASGTTTVKVALPDNLTIFKIRAKATHGTARFGAGTSQIRVRLPLIVQPSLPRFARPGDAFEATGITRVVEGDEGGGRAEIAVEGLVLATPTRRDVDLAKAPTRLGFMVTVPTPPLNDDGIPQLSDVVVRMGVERDGDGASDAFEARLPIRPDRVPEYQRQIADLTAGPSVLLEGIPERAREGSVRRSVVVADHPGLVKMAGAMDFMRDQQVCCTAQRLQVARVWVAAADLETRLGIRHAVPDADAAVLEAIEWLPQVRDDNGLIASWPGTRGKVRLTAEALMFLVEAQAAGHPVPQALREDLARTLKRSLRSDWQYFIDGESWYERTQALWALSAYGEHDAAYLSELVRSAEYLSHDGVASVVLAGLLAGEESAVQPLIGELLDGVTVQLYQGEEVYGGLEARRTTRSPLILPSETRSLARMTRAIHGVTVEEPKLDLMIDALATLGKEDGWGNTDANAEALFALAQRFERSGSPPMQATLSYPGTPEVIDFGGERPAATHTTQYTGDIDVSLTEGDEAVVLSTTQYLPQADGSQQEADAQGFVVERTLLRIGDNQAKVVEVVAGGEVELTVGEVIEDHVQVVNPQTRHYVAITVPLAAGMEPLNPNLDTAPTEATPSAPPTRAPSYAQYLDDRVTFFYETLPTGTYDFRFRVKAMHMGSYVQPAATASMIYQPTTRGHSHGTRVVLQADGQ